MNRNWQGRESHVIDRPRTSIAVLLAAGALGLSGCIDGLVTVSAEIIGASISPSVFTSHVLDPAGDPDASAPESPPEGPQYFAEADYRKVACAIQDDRLCVYIEVAGVFSNRATPTGYASELAGDRTLNVGIDADNSTATGFASWGMDIQITFHIYAGGEMTTYYGVYEQNETATNDIERFDGLIHAGGLGESYVIVSAPLSALTYLNTTLTAGATVTIMGWAEAESTSYHHFSVDTLTEDGATDIQTTLSGE
jgi:hypothetical protein